MFVDQRHQSPRAERPSLVIFSNLHVGDFDLAVDDADCAGPGAREAVADELHHQFDREAVRVDHQRFGDPVRAVGEQRERRRCSGLSVMLAGARIDDAHGVLAQCAQRVIRMKL